MEIPVEVLEIDVSKACGKEVFNITNSTLKPTMSAGDLYDQGTMTSVGVGKVLLVSVYVPVFLIAIVGNVFVLLAILLDHRMRKSAANFLLVNMAIADLLVAVFCIPITAAQVVNQVWVFGDVMCKGTEYLQGISIVASVLTIVCMAFDRYFAIRHPMRNRQIFTVRRVKQLILVTWFLAAILVVPLLVVRKVERIDIGLNNTTDYLDLSQLFIQYCTEVWPSAGSRQIYDLIFLVLVYVIPGALTFFLYMRIGTTLWAKDQTLTRQNSYVANEEKIVLTRRRLALLMIIISLLFAACWLPYYIINICLDFDTSNSKQLIPLYPFTLLLGHSNSAQNPVLYCFMHKGFQRIVLRMLRCQCRVFFNSERSLRRHQTESTHLRKSPEPEEICRHGRNCIKGDHINIV